MSDYQGACNTGGFASMEHQQERARQAIRATIAGGNGDVNSIRYDISQQAALCGPLPWYQNLTKYMVALSIYDGTPALTQTERAKMTSIINGWAY